MASRIIEERGRYPGVGHNCKKALLNCFFRESSAHTHWIVTVADDHVCARDVRLFTREELAQKYVLSVIAARWEELTDAKDRALIRTYIDAGEWGEARIAWNSAVGDRGPVFSIDTAAECSKQGHYRVNMGDFPA